MTTTHATQAGHAPADVDPVGGAELHEADRDPERTVGRPVRRTRDEHRRVDAPARLRVHPERGVAAALPGLLREHAGLEARR